MGRPNQNQEKVNCKKHTSIGNKNKISDIRISDESKFEGFCEEDFDEEINILLNKAKKTAIFRFACYSY